MPLSIASGWRRSTRPRFFPGRHSYGRFRRSVSRFSSDAVAGPEPNPTCSWSDVRRHGMGRRALPLAAALTMALAASAGRRNKRRLHRGATGGDRRHPARCAALRRVHPVRGPGGLELAEQHEPEGAGRQSHRSVGRGAPEKCGALCWKRVQRSSVPIDLSAPTGGGVPDEHSV